MEYTNEMYEQDKKIAQFTFGKYFKKYGRYKDDLVQYALIKAPKVREMYNEEKGAYSSYAMLHFRSRMINFLIAERRHNNLSNDLSFDTKYNDEDITLYDFIGYEEDYTLKLRTEELKKIVYEIIVKPRYNDNKPLTHDVISYIKRRKTKIKTEQKHAIEYFINEKSVQEIAEEKDISKQAVSHAVKKYRVIIQEELQKRGYFQRNSKA